MTKKKPDDPEHTPTPRGITAGDLRAFVCAYQAATLAAQTVSDTLAAASIDQDHAIVIASLTHDRRPHVVLINHTRTRTRSGVRTFKIAGTDDDPAATAAEAENPDNAAGWRHRRPMFACPQPSTAIPRSRVILRAPRLRTKEHAQQGCLSLRGCPSGIRGHLSGGGNQTPTAAAGHVLQATMAKPWQR